MSQDSRNERSDQQPPQSGSYELAALKKRMVDAAVGNFLCSGWHIWLGISILTSWRSSQAGLAHVFLGFAMLQIVAGAWMLGSPNRWLFIVDAGIYLFCGLMNMIAAEVGAATWIRFLGMFQLLLSLDAFRRYRLFRTAERGTLVTPLGIDDADDASPAEVSDEQTLVPSVSASTETTAVKDSRLAGRSQNGRWVVTPKEMAEIPGQYEQYDNVITAVRRSQTGGGEVWYIVLGKGSAVAFQLDNGQIWSLDPKDQAGGLMRSVDGRSELLNFTDHAAPWVAWCGTEFSPETWRLLAWTVETGKQPQGWLSFPLPYSTVREGFAQLCRDKKVLLTLVKTVGPKAAAKWLPHVAPEDATTITEVVRAAASRRAVFCTAAGLVMLAAGVGVTYWLWQRDLEEAKRLKELHDPRLKPDPPLEKALVFLLFASPGLVGVGLLIYGYFLRRFARSLKPNTER